MPICPGNPGTRTWRERLREEINELLRVDEFGKGMCSGLDEVENLLCGHYREEIRERRARNRREEKMSARLETSPKQKKKKYMR
jgi:hypothetical protein